MKAPRRSAVNFRWTEGYTLVELVVVLAVLGVLATVAMPLADMTVRREKERELRRSLWELRGALDAYRQARESGAIGGGMAGSMYPPNLEALLQPHPDLRPGRQGQILRFLRRVPRDPFADPALPAAKSWGLRSYASDASDPHDGADVFDVYSQAPGKGLNGLALREW